MNALSTMKAAVSSTSAKTAVKDLYQNVLDLLGMDSIAAIELIKKVKDFPSAVRDGIFFECLEAYILNLNNYDNEGKMVIEDNLRKMAAALAETIPNEESGYEGDANRLHAYSKRILKLIDDCGTVQKAAYLANVSRALAKHEIDKRVFFKLGQCIRMLTEEDLLFLGQNIREGIILDIEYVDDFRGIGLMYEVDAGFAYSLKAFQLLKYALNYEGSVHIPEKFPKRNVLSIDLDGETLKINTPNF